MKVHLLYYVNQWDKISITVRGHNFKGVGASVCDGISSIFSDPLLDIPNILAPAGYPKIFCPSFAHINNMPSLRRDDTLLKTLDRNKTLLPFLCSP